MALPFKLAELNISFFEKALKSLSEALKAPKTKMNRDATIQRFEYTFELSWKFLKRYLKLNNNIDVFNLKDIFRDAGKQGLIENVEKWFEYLEARNLTSHTYDENTAEKVYEKAKEFEKAAHFLLTQFKKILR